MIVAYCNIVSYHWEKGTAPEKLMNSSRSQNRDEVYKMYASNRQVQDCHARVTVQTCTTRLFLHSSPADFRCHCMLCVLFSRHVIAHPELPLVIFERGGHRFVFVQYFRTRRQLLPHHLVVGFHLEKHWVLQERQDLNAVPGNAQRQASSDGKNSFGPN